MGTINQSLPLTTVSTNNSADYKKEKQHFIIIKI